MNGYPKMNRVWLTKYILDISGINVQMYYWSKSCHSPKYKFCCTKDEYNMHMCHCMDPGQDSMFWMSVGELSTWLCSSLVDHTVVAMVEHYLLSCGEVQMTDSIHRNNRNLFLFAIASDRLGWESMLEGRISTLLAVMASLLLRSGRGLLPHA